jgi:hypothetical protein
VGGILPLVRRARVSARCALLLSEFYQIDFAIDLASHFVELQLKEVIRRNTSTDCLAAARRWWKHSALIFAFAIRVQIKADVAPRVGARPNKIGMACAKQARVLIARTFRRIGKACQIPASQAAF